MGSKCSRISRSRHSAILPSSTQSRNDAKIWDILDGTNSGRTDNTAVQHGAKVRCAAALAYENESHTKVIEPLKQPDYELLAITAQAFQQDFERCLAKDVRDAISYTAIPYGTGCPQAGTPQFSSDKIPTAYKQHFLNGTHFAVDVQKLTVDPTTAARKWVAFLDFMGDERCGYIRNVRFHLKGITVSLLIEAATLIPQIMHRPAHLKTPGIDFYLRAEDDSCVKQSDPNFFSTGAWLRQCFDEITANRDCHLGGGRFGMRDMNKIGKTLFRLPAMCCWLMRKKAKDKRKEREDSGAYLVVPDDVAVLHREVLLPTELELRKHADECTLCNCAWVRQADGAA